MELACKHIDPNCHVVIRSNVGKEECHHYLKWMASQTNKVLLIVYFSGHGREKDGLYTYLQMQDDQEINANDIVELFTTKELANTEKLFLFDMCRTTGSKLHKRPVPTWENVYIMYACSEGERAVAAKKKGSIFTYTFKECVLNSKANERLNFPLIRKMVTHEVEQKFENEQQHPKFEIINDSTNDSVPGFYLQLRTRGM